MLSEKHNIMITHSANSLLNLVLDKPPSRLYNFTILFILYQYNIRKVYKCDAEISSFNNLNQAYLYV
jgi:hypothetical protein